MRIAEATRSTLVLSRHPARQRSPGATNGAIDGHVEIGLGVVDHQIGGTVDGELDVATFVVAAARPVDVGQDDGDPADAVPGPVDGKAKAPFDMLASFLAEIEASGLGHDVHQNSPLALIGECSLGHAKTSDKSNILYRQIDFY